MIRILLVGVLSTISLLGFLSAVQAQPGQGNPPPLPAEAYTACADKAQGDSCTSTMGDRTITGTCDIPPSTTGSTRLACKPSGPPPQR
jgi:hypothetical protein